MKSPSIFLIFPLISLFASVAPAQQSRPGTGVMDSQVANVANLPAHKIEPNDLIGVSVYDAPEMTRTVRVGDDGHITLPLIKQPIEAAGLVPGELEKVIAEVLRHGQILVRPEVTVTILEYNSRRISVVGAVRSAQTFQITTETRLMDALAKAGGPSDAAGPDLLLTRPGAAAAEKIDLKKLLTGDNAGMNIILQGGEEIRVPEARNIYIVGSVMHPAVVPVRDPSQTSVIKMLAYVQGTTPYAANTAWIYRDDPAGGARKQIPIPLRDILKRKAPDISLLADDILYVPDSTRRKASDTTSKALLAYGQSVASSLIYLGLVGPE